ncbi:hypothetical protein L3Q82_010993 [Scortum barcoo]|uniref:Uncharacterized protein n=1 Tax=Scortum barcoo TaxID=214431 RepID=A0ACB8WBL1_9TELE|nr:hypothetical protein L3Q82_010993 [Scortum barcoo]
MAICAHVLSNRLSAAPHRPTEDWKEHTDSSTPRLVYSSNFLHALRAKSHIGVVPCLPVDVRKPYRGCTAGAMLKVKRLAKKWRFKPPVLPSMIMGNVNSLPNKIGELAALTKNLKTFREVQFTVPY